MGYFHGTGIEIWAGFGPIGSTEKKGGKMLTYFFARDNMQNHPQKLLIIGPDPFFQYCQLAQIQPKSKFLFHKNLPPLDFSIMTLPVNMSSSPSAKFLPGSFSNHGRHIGIIEDRLESSENSGMGLSTLIRAISFCVSGKPVNFCLLE